MAKHAQQAQYKTGIAVHRPTGIMRPVGLAHMLKPFGQYLLWGCSFQLGSDGFGLFGLKAIQQHSQQLMTVLLLEPLHASQAQT